MSRKPFDHFDLLAPYYDRFLKPGDLGRFMKLVGLPTSGLLLDAAGGTGGKSHPLSEMVSGIVVADSSMGMLSEAVKKKGLMTVCSGIELLPFKDGLFEKVIMVDALHHVDNYRAAVKELWRALKPGGCIVIEEPDIRTFPVKVMAFVEKVALMRSHFISPPTIAAAFDYPEAEVKIEVENFTAWIVIHKLNS